MYLKDDVLSVTLTRSEFNRRVTMAGIIGFGIGVCVTAGSYIIFL